MGELISKQRTVLGDVDLFPGVAKTIDDGDIDRLLGLGNGHGFGLVKAGVLLVRRGDPAAASTPEEKASIATRSAADSMKAELAAKADLAAEQAAHGETRAKLEIASARVAELEDKLEANAKALGATVLPEAKEPASKGRKG